MRSIVASLLMTAVIAALVVAVATVAALGVAGIGWLVHRLFGLTQWQGTLVALATTLGVGFLIYQLSAPPPPSIALEPPYEEWDGEEEPPEPSVVPWRQRRPTPGDLNRKKPRSHSK